MKRLALAFLFIFSTAWAEEYKTDNFIIDAPTTAQAEALGKKAEALRESIAKQFGQKLKKTDTPTRIYFSQGWDRYGETIVRSNQAIRINLGGSYDSIMENVLPHEVTHAVITQRFSRNIPRWADEGCAVTSEPKEMRDYYVQRVNEYWEAGKLYRLASLFDRHDYPRNVVDVSVFYAQSYSVTQYLIDKKDRKTFLDFVEDGMNKGWNESLSKHYEISSVQELEKMWLKSIK